MCKHETRLSFRAAASSQGDRLHSCKGWAAAAAAAVPLNAKRLFLFNTDYHIFQQSTAPHPSLCPEATTLYRRGHSAEEFANCQGQHQEPERRESRAPPSEQPALDAALVLVHEDLQEAQDPLSQLESLWSLINVGTFNCVILVRAKPCVGSNSKLAVSCS